MLQRDAAEGGTEIVQVSKACNVKTCSVKTWSSQFCYNHQEDTGSCRKPLLKPPLLQKIRSVTLQKWCRHVIAFQARWDTFHPLVTQCVIFQTGTDTARNSKRTRAEMLSLWWSPHQELWWRELLLQPWPDSVLQVLLGNTCLIFS